MKNKMCNFFKKYQFQLYSFLLSFFVLLFTSKNSFLYPLNDWFDANAFFTVGKSMFKGIIPYKELFEQKGPLFYIIYGFGSLISYKNFIGVFFIEVLFFTIFLYYIHKLFFLFTKEKYSYLSLPILAVLITTSLSFVHGGSCEQFCLSFFAISLYYYCRHFKEKELNYKEFFINGLLAGCIFMIKYTLLGFWFGFMIFLFFDLFLRKKEKKKAFIASFIFLGGMMIPFLIAIIYFLINNALKEFIDSYFIINMTAYPKKVNNIFEKFFLLFYNFSVLLGHNGLLLFLSIILIPLYLKKININMYFKKSIIAILLLTITGLFWGIFCLEYTLLPVFVFLPFSLLFFNQFFTNYLNKDWFKKNYYKICIIIFFASIFLSYYNANYKNMLFSSKEDYFQYKYASYINKFDNPTLLNMSSLDAGLYTTTGIIPNTRFFEVQNISYKNFPDNLDEMKKYVENKEIDFILYNTTSTLEKVKQQDNYIFDNYELIFDDVYYFENYPHNAFLFQLKEKLPTK